MIYNFIIAGNYDQFKRYRDKNPDRLAQYAMKYVNGPNTLKGISNPHGVLTGTWYDRKDIHDIILQIMMATKYNEDTLNALTKATNILKGLGK